MQSRRKLMNRTKLLTLALIGSLAASPIGLAVAAHAESNEAQTNEASVFANAKISISQAIAAAEQKTGGKAVGSGIDDQDGTVFLEVRILKDSQTQKVLVDPQTGQVVKTVAENDGAD